MKKQLEAPEATEQFGRQLGRLLRGGETIELVGDVGAGKTALTKAIAAGMKIEDEVLSPTFTLSRSYESPTGVRLVHYDFYRLQDAGILRAELEESVSDPQGVTVIEWADIVQNVLPADRLTVHLVATSETTRMLSLVASGAVSQRVLQELAA